METLLREERVTRATTAPGATATLREAAREGSAASVGDGADGNERGANNGEPTFNGGVPTIGSDGHAVIEGNAVSGCEATSSGDDANRGVGATCGGKASSDVGAWSDGDFARGHG